MKKAKPAASKGPGFGNALFSIKDVVMDYASFDQGSPASQPVAPPVPKKNPIAPKIQPKPVVQSNQPTLNKPKTFHQQQSPSIPKQQFKIGVGKQFQNHVNFTSLNVIAYTKGVYELTPSKNKSPWQYNIFCDGVSASEIVQKPQVSFSFNADDIKQGALGNCYFVSSLASLAHLPEILRARIPDHKQYDGKTKTFKVYLFESGKCIEILVDNMFNKIYCKPVLNDISPIILQKAYAQSYGNFQILKIGHANDALRDLTGAPAVYVDIKNNKQQFRDSLKSAFLNKYAVVIGSKPQTLNQTIASMHSYSVLNYEMINGQMYLMLRDPRGSTKAYFQTPEKLVNMPELGMFWVDEKTLQQNFQVVSVCKVRRGYQYFYKSFDKKQLTNNRGGILMTVNKPMKVYVTIHQKHKKFFDQNFSYDIIRILIAQVSTSKNSFKVVKTIESGFKSLQAWFLEVDLQPKQYMVLGQIGKKKGKDLFSKQIFTLSIYSESDEIKFEQVTGNIDVKPFLISQIKQKGQEYFTSSTPQNLFRYQVALFGYICMYYQNRGNKKVLEELECTATNVEVGEKKVQLLPNESKILIHPIGSNNSCSHKWSVKMKTFYS